MFKTTKYSIHEKIINTKELTEIPQKIGERIYIVCITKSIENTKNFPFQIKMLKQKN